jgi:hypothetical protein
MIEPGWKTTGVAILALMTAACSDGPFASGDAGAQYSVAAPVVISFEKEFTGDFANGPWQWDGTAVVPGIGTATLFSSIDLSQLRATGQTLHAPVYWSITAPGFSIELLTEGIINLQTGIVRTSGRVISGNHNGATVHQQGQLDGLDASGFLRIHPASAD